MFIVLQEYVSVFNKILFNALTYNQMDFYFSGGLDEFQLEYSDLCKSSLKCHEHKPLYSPTTPIIEPAIETATASQILPFLFLGKDCACLLCFDNSQNLLLWGDTLKSISVCISVYI